MPGSHTSCDYGWVYAYGLFALGLVRCPVAGQILGGGTKELYQQNNTILATLEPPQGLASTAPNWSLAVSKLD